MDPVAIVADLGVVAVVGGVLALERRGAFQLMLSQPVVALPILGVLLLGDVTQALWLGSLLQLLWMSSVLFGANVPPNETLASVAIGGMVLLFGRHLGTADVAVWTSAILLGVPLSAVGRLLDVRLDQANKALAERADEAAKGGSMAGLAAVPPLALLRAFAVNAVVVALGAAVGLAVLGLAFGEGLASARLSYALSIVGFYVVPAVGVAVALSVVRRRRALLVAAVFYVALVAVM